MAARAGSKITEFLLSGNIIPFFVDPAFFAPRMCGEKQSFAQVAVQVVGSPPRMRGKDAVDIPVAVVHGITPACAGKSEQGAGLILRIIGSPPHVRGKVLAALMPENRVRITPAYAGKRHRMLHPPRKA